MNSHAIDTISPQHHHHISTLTVTPQVVDQEMWNPLISVMNYWEGTCTVTGTINGQAVTGKAYQEQTLMMTMQGSGAIWQALIDALGL